MRYLPWTAAILVACTLNAGSARAQAPKAGEPDPAKVKAKMVNAAYLLGQLTSVDNDEKKYSIQVIDKIQVLNQKMQQKLTTAQQAYANAARSRNNGAMATHAAEIRDAQSKLYDAQEVPYDFDLKGTDKLVVRTQITPTTKEDGTKYTQVELAGLKGNTGLPGYATKLASLEKGQWVRAYIDKNKLGSKFKDDVPLPLVTLVIEPDKDKEKDKPTPKK